MFKFLFKLHFTSTRVQKPGPDQPGPETRDTKNEKVEFSTVFRRF